MTEVTPKELFERRNSDNIFTRCIIIGMLRLLNNKIVYQQIWDDTEEGIENINLKFFYNFGEAYNSEKFIQDNYIFFGDKGCSEAGIKKFDGDFDLYPRGILTLDSCTIDAGNICNRFVMGKYDRRIGNEIKSFVSFLYSIPLTYTFNVEIRSENMTTALKIDQSMREIFYKNQTFYVNYKGTRVGCRCGFAESLTTDKAPSYQMGAADNDKYYKQTMSLTVETYQPVFDPTTDQPIEQKITKVFSSFFDNSKNPVEKKKLSFVDNYSNTTIHSGTDMFLEWTQSYDNYDTLYVDIFYRNRKTGKEIFIDTVNNSCFYTWKVPEEMYAFDSGGIDIIIPNTETMYVYQTPNIKVSVDDDLKTVTPDNIEIFNKGYFITDDNYVMGIMSYYNENVKKLEEIEFKLNLLNNQIDLSNPIEFKPFVFQSNYEPTYIDIIVRDKQHPEIEDIMENIRIL